MLGINGFTFRIVRGVAPKFFWWSTYVFKEIGGFYFIIIKRALKSTEISTRDRWIVTIWSKRFDLFKSRTSESIQ
jgi:hypothetical protein